MEKLVLLTFAVFLLALIMLITSIFNNDLIYIFIYGVLTVCTAYVVGFAVSIYKKEK